MDQRKEVILIDDDEEALSFYCSVLQSAGFECLEFVDARQALPEIRKRRYPVVVTDLQMPAMSGIELLKCVRSEQPDALVTLLTGYAGLETAIEALHEGAFAYIQKVDDPKELVRVVASAYNKVRLMSEQENFLASLRAAKAFEDSFMQTTAYTVVAIDADGRIVKVNRGFEKLLGYSAQELEGRRLAELVVDPKQYDAWTGPKQGKEAKDLRVSFIEKSGKALSCSLSGTVLRDDSGRMVGFVGSAKLVHVPEGGVPDAA